jgi:lipoprotein-anchoring transpeptidase ErfK/SrfK
VRFEEEVRYPKRVAGDLYVAADVDSVRPFDDVGNLYLDKKTVASTTKRIVVSLSKQMLSAYDGGTLFMQESVSTGLAFTPTPTGEFTVYKKMPSRYMQGSLLGLSRQYYDLPGVPWNLYFTLDGMVIHGTYWHNSFGKKWSHGCVNLSSQKAKELYYWADLGTPVTVEE